MKKMNSILMAICMVAVFVLAACSNSGNNNKDGYADSAHPLDISKLQDGTTYYQCSMDPQITSDKPGKCPICKMDLSKMTK